MTGPMIPFDASNHASADAVLPFYVNATLRGEELAFVEQHVRACEQCQREVEWLRRVFADLAAHPALQDVPRAAGVAGSGRDLDHRRRRGGWKARLQGGVRAAPPWTRWLLAAQLAAIAVLATSLMTDSREVAGYRTLGASNPSAQLPGTIAVIFEPDTTQSAMQRIIFGVDGKIVDGPTRGGVLVLEIPDERAAQALQVLRAERAVRLAERLGPGTGR